MSAGRCARHSGAGGGCRPHTRGGRLFSASLSLLGALVLAAPAPADDAGLTVHADADRSTLEIASVYPRLEGATEALVVSVVLNGEAKGDLFIQRDRSGGFLLRIEDLKGLGIRADEQQSVFIQNERYLPLTAVRDGAASFDERTLTLSLITRSLVAPGTIIDLTPPPQRKRVFVPRDTSLFLNYGIASTTIRPEGSRTLSATSKFGARTGNLLFLTDGLYTHSEDRDEMVRLMSSFTYERREDLQWIVLGDQFVSSGMLGSTVNIGGLGVAKVYHLDPYFIKRPLFSMSGAAALPSQADIYLDGILVSRQTIRPGAFDIQNFNYYGGAHRIDVVLRDAFGNEQTLSSQAYFTDALLRSGLHEYGYYAGVLREQYGAVSGEYGRPVLSAFHRYGLNSAMTVGARGEGGKGLWNGGLEASFIVPAAGTVTAGGAGSRRFDERGAAGYVTHMYQRKSLTTRLSYQRMTRDYRTLATPDSADLLKAAAGASVGWSLGGWGGVSLGYTEAERFNGTGSTVISTTYSKALSRSSSFFVTGRTVREQDTEYDVFIGFQYAPDTRTQITAQYQRTGDTRSETLQYQRNTPVGEGLGYRATVQRQEGNEDTRYAVSPFVQYNARYGSYSLDTRIEHLAGGDTSESVILSAAGSLVYAGGFFGLSRPVDDSFGIVLAEGLEGAAVLLNNSPITTVGSSGRAVIPNLASYGENRIALDPGSVPVDVSLTGTTGLISPSAWSGSCISYDSANVQALIGRLAVRRDGSWLPIEYHEVTMQVGDRQISFITGSDGEFYLENVLPPEPASDGSDPRSCSAAAERMAKGGNVIRPDVYDAWVTYEGARCAFRIIFPITDDVMTDVGTLPCSPQ